MAVFAYGRFSSKPQEEGDSTRRQTDLFDRWCQKNGQTLDESLGAMFDKGLSGRTGKHLKQGYLGRFLEGVKSGRVRRGDILLIENIDRLSRQEPTEALEWILEIFNAGVEIITLAPSEIRYTKASVNSYAIFGLIGELKRAFDESDRKSQMGKSRWEGRREQISEKPLTGRCPAWLKLSEDKRRFELIPERVALVRRIFSLAGQGWGVSKIAKQFNEERIPKFWQGDLWQTSYILKILRNRAVIGEFQPHRMVDGSRKAVGEAIPDYFPAVIKSAEFYRVQTALDGRKCHRGRIGRQVTNLITGLAVDARDRMPLQISRKTPGHGGLRLVSSGAKFGKEGSQYISVSYGMIEQSLLVLCDSLELGDVLPKQKASDVLELIAEKEGQLANVDHRISLAQERLETSEEPEAILTAIENLAKKRRAMEAELELLRRQIVTNETESLDRLKELLSQIQTCTEDELYNLRLRIRDYLRRLIDDIYVLILIVGDKRIAVVDVKLVNGVRRAIVAKPCPDVYLPEEIEGRDIRTYSEWPKKPRRVHWTC